MNRPAKLSRRAMLHRGSQAAVLLALTSDLSPLFAAPDQRRFKIGACDWSIDKMGDSGAFEVGRQIGLDGVQVSLGTAANNMRLRRPEIQSEYLAAARKAGLEVASLAIGELNEIPYKSDPRTIEWVNNAVDVCRSLGASGSFCSPFLPTTISGETKRAWMKSCGGSKQLLPRRKRRVSRSGLKAG